jgi:hypothetical protein
MLRLGRCSGSEEAAAWREAAQSRSPASGEVIGLALVAPMNEPPNMRVQWTRAARFARTRSPLTRRPLGVIDERRVHSAMRRFLQRAKPSW